MGEGEIFTAGYQQLVATRSALDGATAYFMMCATKEADMIVARAIGAKACAHVEDDMWEGKLRRFSHNTRGYYIYSSLQETIVVSPKVVCMKIFHTRYLVQHKICKPTTMDNRPLRK